MKISYDGVFNRLENEKERKGMNDLPTPAVDTAMITNLRAARYFLIYY